MGPVTPHDSVRVAGPTAGTRLSGPHGQLSPLLILNAAGEDWLVCVIAKYVWGGPGRLFIDCVI